LAGAATGAGAAAAEAAAAVALASVGICQLICGWPSSARALFAPENGLLPKNVFADRGDGWPASRMRCFFLSINSAFFLAELPHSRKTAGFARTLMALMTASVNVSQPCSLCELAFPDCTVSTALSKSTPCEAHEVR